MSQPRVREFFDPATWTLTFLVDDPTTKDAVVIDPVLDYDPASGRTSTASLEKLSAVIAAEGLTVHFALETHPHADHLSGGQWLKQKHGAKVAIGVGVKTVQKTFGPIFDRGDMPTDGSQFDRLLSDREIAEAGTLRIECIATPGHTPACMTYEIGDALFTGDALFIEDYGTGRCDFPNGSAEQMYDSIHERLYTLPASTRVFPGHDYLPNGRALRFETTIGASKETNVHLRASTKKPDFVAMRKGRDATLSVPRLLYPSVQVNMDAGRLPPARANGQRYLVIPVK
jgi:glyoxylase-like metal-dependent hydrolase (beta-lactamase superfamily II)